MLVVFETHYILDIIKGPSIKRKTSIALTKSFSFSVSFKVILLERFPKSL